MALAKLRPLIRLVHLNRRILLGYHTSTTMSKEQMDELKANPYFDKYADKIAKLQKTSPEEFLSRLADRETEKNKPKFGGGPGTSQEKDFSLPTKPKSDIKGGATSMMLKEKTLSDKMKVELLADKSEEEISEIWREYHRGKDSVCAVIPVETFKKMAEKFNEFKTFLFPLPRKQGYEFIVVQFEGQEAHFTSLINYQAYKENAPECLTLVHYTDLAEDKGIVLMAGDYDKNSLTSEEASCLCKLTILFYGFRDAKKELLLQRFTHMTEEFNHLDLSTPEAQCLANQVEMYYCNPSAEKLKLLQTFTHQPNDFKHADLIAQLETVNLLTK